MANPINWQNGVTPINENNMNQLAQEPMISDAYDSSHSYVVGDYCIYGNTLYRCTGATTGSWNSSKWSATSIATELTNRLEFEIVDSW
jgi:hypothetical protein